MFKLLLYITTATLFVANATHTNAQSIGLKSCVDSCFTKYDMQLSCTPKKVTKPAKKVKHKRKVNPVIIEPLCTVTPTETIYVDALPDLTSNKLLGGTTNTFAVHQSMAQGAINHVNTSFSAGISGSFGGFGNNNGYLLPANCINGKAGYCKNNPLINVKQPISQTPLPASAWLFMSGIALIFKRKFK